MISITVPLPIRTSSYRNLVCVVALLLSFDCAAADAAGNYAIWGVGRASCNQFAKTNADDLRFRQYLMGYLTAFNTLSDDTYNAIGARSFDASLEWLVEYCGQNQMDSYDRAIQQMVDSGFDSRHRVPPGRERGWGRAAVKQQAPEASAEGSP